MSHSILSRRTLHASRGCLMLIALLCALESEAQIRPPGYEREVAEMEQRRYTNVLDRDSLTVIDTIVLYDPDTYAETMRIVKSRISWREYCTGRLGINQPEQLLNGAPMTLTDPRTFEKVVVQWNASTSKLDTIRRE